MFDVLTTELFDIASYLTDANKRIFVLYLLSSVVFAAWVYIRLPAQNKQSSFVSYLFDKRVWLADSAKQDYLMFVFNKLLKGFSWGAIVLTMVPVALFVSDLLETLLGAIDPVTQDKVTVIACFTLLLFLLDDLTRFLLHWALHKIPVLWDIHKVHHSATVLTPMTIYRSHPIESFLYACRMAIAQGAAVGIGYYLFATQLQMYDWLGANLFVFIFNIMGFNLRHSHVRWCWPHWLEKWFISPAQHQLHHSDNPVHFDKNLGSALAIWDRMLGSLVVSDTKADITFGIGDKQTDHSSLLKLYIQPFVDIKNRLASRL